MRIIVCICLLCILMMQCKESKIDKNTGETEIGMVAHWDFNIGQGDTLPDISKYLNHGILHGPQWIKNAIMEFDGIDDYVEVEDNGSLDISEQITIEARVKKKKVPTATLR